MNILQDVIEFHQKFGLEQRQNGVIPKNELLSFRIKFLLEELQEFNKAIGENDLAEATDALVDLVYVALGTAYLLNLPFKEAWYSVHAANMQKTRATSAKQSKRNTSLDIIKPKEWRAPDHSLLLHKDDLILKNKNKQSQQLDLFKALEDIDAA